MARRASTPPGREPGRNGGFAGGTSWSRPQHWQSSTGGYGRGGSGGSYPSPGSPVPQGYPGPAAGGSGGGYRPPPAPGQSPGQFGAGGLGGLDLRSTPPGTPQHGRGPRPAPGRRRLINYPRSGRTRWTRWVPSWKLVSGLIGLGILFMVVLFLVAYASTTVPSPDTKIAAQTTIIYYGDGTSEIGRISTQDRQNVRLADVPKPVQDAVLAAEDHTFWQNSGVDPKSLVRAAWANARGHATQGGSTITQQYVKNVYDLRDRSVQRKAKEFFIALKLNRTKSKSEILERYLNTIYMGRGAYGIQAATQAYFGNGKNVGDLSVSEAAFLAGLINAPSKADPFDGGMGRAQFRWKVVLDAMVADGTLSAADRAQITTFPKVRPTAPSTSMSGQKGYMMDVAEKEASLKLNKTKDEISTGGYTITTTFQKNLVIAANKAVKDQLLNVPGRPKNMQAGLVTIDPKSGAVKALYGGTDWVTHQNNNATMAIAEAGSTFKPFTLVAALKDGYSLRSRYSGSSPKTFPGAKAPIHNFGNESLGTIDLQTATAKSVNTVFVALNQDIGADKTMDAAIAAGIPKDTTGLDTNLTNVLGTASPHVIDMASAYATFAAGGVHRTPYVVQSVGLVGSGKPNGQFDHDASAKPGTRAFDPDVVADLTQAMRQVVIRGSGSYAQGLHREVAGKTGTSTNSRSAWFVGFTPQYSTAVAMFEPTAKGGAQEMKGFGGFNSITGGSFPVRIWTQYMQTALQGKPEISFPNPPYGGEFHGTPAPTRPPVVVTTPPTGAPTPTGSGEPIPTTTFQNPFPTRTKQPRPPTPRGGNSVTP